MTRGAVSGRVVAAVLVAAVAVPATARPLATVRFESLDALADVVDVLAEVVAGASDRDELHAALLGLVGMADLGIDETRPLALGLPVAGAAMGWKGFVAVLPVSDTEVALGELSARADTHEVDGDGVHALADGYTTLHARAWEDHLVVGYEKSFVTGFDARTALAGLGSLPDMATVDFDVEPLGVLLQAAVMSTREAIVESLLDEEVPLGRDFRDVYFDGLLGLLRATRRLQAGVRVESDHLLATGRLVPRASTGLAELGEAQIGDFPSLAGMVAEGRSLIVAGDVTFTRTLLDAMNRLSDVYLDDLEAEGDPGVSPNGETRQEVLARYRESLGMGLTCLGGAFAESMESREGRTLRYESVQTLSPEPSCREHFSDPRHAVDATPGFAESSRVDDGPTIEGTRTYRVSTDAGSLEERLAWLGEDADSLPYGDDYPVRVAYRDDLVITTEGEDADRRIREMLGAAPVRGRTLSADLFRPLRRGASLYMRLHIRDLIDLAAEPGEILDARLRGALSTSEGTLLLSFTGGPEGLSFEMGVPLAVIRAVAKAAGGMAVATPAGP